MDMRIASRAGARRRNRKASSAKTSSAPAPAQHDDDDDDGHHDSDLHTLGLIAGVSIGIMINRRLWQFVVFCIQHQPRGDRFHLQ
jgi:hypothetical protein